MSVTLSTFGPGLPDDAVRLTNTLGETIPDNAATVLTFDVERFDTGGMFNPAAGDRITIPVTGTYLLHGQATFNINATGVRRLLLQVNGTNNVAISTELSMGAALGTQVIVSSIVRLVASDFVRLLAFQTSGGDLDVNTSFGGANDNSPIFAAARLA